MQARWRRGRGCSPLRLGENVGGGGGKGRKGETNHTTQQQTVIKIQGGTRTSASLPRPSEPAHVLAAPLPLCAGRPPRPTAGSGAEPSPARPSRDRLSETGGGGALRSGSYSGAGARAPFLPSPRRALIGRARPRTPATVEQRTFYVPSPRPSAERRVPSLDQRLRQSLAPPPRFPPNPSTP